MHFPTEVKEINSTTNLRYHFQNDIINYMLQKVDEVMLEGFTLSRIDKLTVQIFKHDQLRRSGSVKLPKTLKNKKSISNLGNTYDECFKRSILDNHSVC